MSFTNKNNQHDQMISKYLKGILNANYNPSVWNDIQEKKPETLKKEIQMAQERLQTYFSKDEESSHIMRSINKFESLLKSKESS